ncbi:MULTISPECIES: energy transducer TonB [unclassified Methylophilus]|uniref:energy transducer TonB n=1 Tax=unclassified Methylophilus TaxID=2630143 RepID=UPI0003636CC4|nr:MULTISPECIES: energy transducer TonB [unclassified Methylophilus]
MQAVLKESKQFSHVLEWCLIASLLIHAAIMFTMPKPDYDLPPPKKQEIRIELVKEQPPAPAQPVAEPEPTPVKPEPPKPQPVKSESKPVEHKPVEQKPVAPQKPSPTPEPPTETPRQVVESPAPAVITAKPTVSEAKPEMVAPPAPPAPPPEPVKASGPSEGDIEAARNAFKEAAQREIQKNLRYPRIALERGIEGVTNLHITFDDHGNVTSIEVVESSGNKAIDEAAIATIKKSQLKSLFNDLLRGRLKSTNVPVSFKLAS